MPLAPPGFDPLPEFEPGDVVPGFGLVPGFEDVPGFDVLPGFDEPGVVDVPDAPGVVLLLLGLKLDEEPLQFAEIIRTEATCTRGVELFSSAVLLVPAVPSGELLLRALRRAERAGCCGIMWPVISTCCPSWPASTSEPISM